MATAALDMQGVTKRYGKRMALDGLNLRVARGALLGLVGSNGAGKTTTLSIAGGMTRPSAGTVNVLGDGPFDAALAAGRLSLIPQDATFPAYATVQDLLFFYARLQGMEARAARRSVNEVLEWIHLADRATSTIRALSHGMRRRVALAQAFLGAPELILLDEPMSGLDPREVVNARNFLATRKGHQTIIISSHNLAELERICDDVAFIERGRTLHQDTMSAVTGRKQVITYYLVEEPQSLTTLQAGLPGARFSLRAIAEPLDGEPAGCRAVLQCEVDDITTTPAATNARVLPALLASNLGLLEVRCGRELEQAYLEVSDRA